MAQLYRAGEGWQVPLVLDTITGLVCKHERPTTETTTTTTDDGRYVKLVRFETGVPAVKHLKDEADDTTANDGRDRRES